MTYRAMWEHLLIMEHLQNCVFNFFLFLLFRLSGFPGFCCSRLRSSRVVWRPTGSGWSRPRPRCRPKLGPRWHGAFAGCPKSGPGGRHLEKKKRQNKLKTKIIGYKKYLRTKKIWRQHFFEDNKKIDDKKLDKKCWRQNKLKTKKIEDKINWETKKLKTVKSWRQNKKIQKNGRQNKLKTWKIEERKLKTEKVLIYGLSKRAINC